jgi:type VI secretion system protein ImpH
VNDRVELADPLAGARDAARARFYERLAARPYDFELFVALRRIEALHADRPRLGDATRPVEEPIRFTQEASLVFAPAAIAAFEREAARPRLVQRVFGFFGPNGALPVHFTEYARERQLYHGDATFARFLDTLLHRFGLFFYRAWARAQPVVALDRPADAAFVRHVAALIGLAGSAERTRDALGDFPKLFFAGRLGREVRDASGLEAWIALHFHVPVRVHQFSGHWMRLGEEERSRLARDGQSGVGRGAVLGRSVWDVQHKFRIVVGPVGWERFSALLPGGRPLDELQAMVRQFVGFEFVWDLRLILRREEVPRWPLGRVPGVGLLGRTSWLNRHAAEACPRDADELIMNVESIRPWRLPAPVHA